MIDGKWIADVLLSPGGGMAALILYQWWRIYNLTISVRKLYGEALEYRERCARAEAQVESRKQVRGE